MIEVPVRTPVALNAVTAIGHSAGAALSTAISGVYIEHNGVKTIWFIVFILSLIAALFMLSLRKYTTKAENKEYAEA